MPARKLTLAPIKHERAMDAVHQALRDAILAARLKPGQRLNPGALADELRVSLMPVRHAIQLLAVEGLVEVRPRSGTFVANVTPHQVRETFEIRCALECLAVEKAVGVVDLPALEKLLESMRRPVTTDAEKRRHEQDNATFHGLLLAAAGNDKLLEMYRGLNAHIQIAGIHAGERDWRSRLDQERVEHQAIVAALAAGDGATAASAMRRHIMRSCDSLIAALKGKTDAAHD